MTSFSFNLPSKQHQQEAIAYIIRWHWLSGFVHVFAWKKQQYRRDKKGRNSLKGNKWRPQVDTTCFKLLFKMIFSWSEYSWFTHSQWPDLADCHLRFCFFLWEIKQTRALDPSWHGKKISIWRWCHKWEAPFIFFKRAMRKEL